MLCRAVRVCVAAGFSAVLALASLCLSLRVGYTDGQACFYADPPVATCHFACASGHFCSEVVTSGNATSALCCPCKQCKQGDFTSQQCQRQNDTQCASCAANAPECGADTYFNESRCTPQTRAPTCTTCSNTTCAKGQMRLGYCSGTDNGYSCADDAKDSGNSSSTIVTAILITLTLLVQKDPPTPPSRDVGAYT